RPSTCPPTRATTGSCSSSPARSARSSTSTACTAAASNTSAPPDSCSPSRSRLDMWPTSGRRCRVTPPGRITRMIVECLPASMGLRRSRAWSRRRRSRRGIRRWRGRSSLLRWSMAGSRGILSC
ncbi:hypothetical protein LTR28_011612, partial [Elasticomyces elasticus]